MSNDFENRSRISRYLLTQIRAEANYVAAYQVDPYTRFIYRRVRELGWTVSAFLRRYVKSGVKRRALHADFTVAPFAEGGPRIFIDVTDLAISGMATGIQRVVREIVRHACELGSAAPVVLSEGRFALALGGEVAGPVEFARGDMLLLADAGWNHVEAYAPALEPLGAAGVKVVACVYDLITVNYPTLYPQVTVASFQSWLELLARYADAAVAISRASADDFVNYMRASNMPLREGFQVGWWRLGADLPVDAGGEPGAATRALAETAFFLGVGTMEMRKAYPVTLCAFEKLWAEGVDARLVIVGRPGWNASAFEEQLRTHSENGRRLRWLDNADDADLRFLYGKARAVIMASFTEGFGLPIVEAAQYGAPVIASDIPVFREIGGDGVLWFDMLDPDSLAARVREALETASVPPKIAHVSWQDSTRELVGLLRNDAYQIKA